MKKYNVTDSSGMGLGRFSDKDVPTLQQYANTHKRNLTLTDPTDGRQVKVITPAQQRGYSFKRVQCITRVHPDDKIKVQEIARQLNEERQNG